jgi:hypothetical protein
MMNLFWHVFFSSFWNQVLYYGVPTRPLCAIGTCVVSQTFIIWTFSKLKWKIDVQILCQFLWWTIWLKEWSTRLDPCFLVAIMAKQMCSRCISRWKIYIRTCELVKFVVGNTLINIEIYHMKTQGSKGENLPLHEI